MINWGSGQGNSLISSFWNLFVCWLKIILLFISWYLITQRGHELRKNPSDILNQFVHSLNWSNIHWREYLSIAKTDWPMLVQTIIALVSSPSRCVHWEGNYQNNCQKCILASFSLTHSHTHTHTRTYVYKCAHMLTHSRAHTHACSLSR